MKTPDYIITEWGCPKLNSAKYSYNNNKFPTMKLAFWNQSCNNNNTQDVNNIKSSINSNNSSKLAELLTDKSRKLLPLRETLAECYTRLLLINNNQYNNNAYRSNDNVRATRISSSAKPISAQCQKQQKNKQNEYIKQQERKNRQITRSHYLHSYTTNNARNTTTPTSNARLGLNNGSTLNVSNSISTDSDLDVF